MRMDFIAADVTLDAPRMTLRTLVPDDVNEAYVSWLNDPEIHRYLMTKSATRDELRRYVAEKRAAPNALFFGIFLKPEERLIGTIKLEPIDVPGKRATIAIMIGDRGSLGKGYGPEALRTLIAYAFDLLALDTVDLGVIADHAGAIRAYEKVGFHEIKRTTGSVTYGDRVHDHVTMIVDRGSLKNH